LEKILLDTKANFITAWEVQFALEAAEKGLIVANGRSLYENGVNMAFQYWNTTLPTTYLTGAAAYDAVGSTPLSKLLHKNGLQIR
jgi:hypothetical protein